MAEAKVPMREVAVHLYFMPDEAGFFQGAPEPRDLVSMGLAVARCVTAEIPDKLCNVDWTWWDAPSIVVSLHFMTDTSLVPELAFQVAAVCHGGGLGGMTGVSWADHALTNEGAVDE